MKPNNFPVRSSLDGTEELYTQTNDVSEKFTLNDVKTFIGGGLEGTNYIVVTANGTAVENAAELQSAYNQAVIFSPSITNRFTIVAAPGYYDFGVSPFIMDTQYIDLVSLDGNRSVIFNSANAAGTISITANDVYVKGVNVETKNFTIGDDLNALKLENCKGGNSSFGGGLSVPGNFINCEGGANSFGGNAGYANGRFTNCLGTSFSFGGGGTANGTFTNCVGKSACFGGGAGANCIASGIFINCKATSGSFGGGDASGTFINCIGEENCFGSAFTSGAASGSFTYCIAGDVSFGKSVSGTLTGKLYYCRLTTGTFQTVSGGGRTIYCIDGSNNTNNQ